MKWQYNVAYLLLFNTTLVYAETIIKPLSIEVIDNKEAPFSDASLDLESFNAIKNISVDTGDLLSEFLGVNAIKNGGFSSLPTIQGLSGDRISIRIDGMSLISSCANHMNPPLSYTSPININNIDVLAGLSSVSQGGDNIGGVIYIESNKLMFGKDEKPVTKGRIQSFFQSNNNSTGINLNLTAVDKDKAFKYFGSFIEANNSYAGGSFKDSGVAASGRGYLAGDEIGSSRFKNQNHQLTLAKKEGQHYYEAMFAYQDSPYQSFPNQRMDSVGNTNYQLNIRHQAEYNWGNLSSQIYYEDTNHKHNFADDKQFTYINVMAQTSYGMPMEANGQTFGILAEGEIFMDDQKTLKIGAEIQLYGLDDKWESNPSDQGMMSGNDFYNINDGERDRYDIYAQLDTLWSDRWLSSIGLRYGLVQTGSSDVQGYNPNNNMGSNQLDDSFAFNNRDRSKTDNNINFSMLGKYTPNKLSSLEFGYTMKAKSPNLYQRYTWSTWTMAANMNNLYGDGNGYVGNIDLRPETAHKIGLLIDHAGSEGRWMFKINPYYSYIDDYIDVESLATRSDGYRNLQFNNHDATIAGIDIAAKRNMFESWGYGKYNLSAKFNYQRGRNIDNSTDLYNLMPANLTMAFNQELGTWKNSFVVTMVDKKKHTDSVRQERETAAFTIADLYSSYRFYDLEIVGSVENIFNRTYDNPNGGEYLGQGATMSTGIMRASSSQVPGMGRSLNLALTYSF